MPAVRQKNAGQLLTTTKKGEFNSLPSQLRAALTVVTERQKVNLDAMPDALTGGVLESVTEQEQTNEFTKQTIEASFPITVTSQVRSDEHGGATVTVTDTYSLSAPTAPTGSLTIIRHEVENLGLIYHERKEENDAASWPLLNGQQYLDDLDIIVQFTEQITTPDAQLGNARTEITPIDNKKQRVRIIAANTDALDSYVATYPSTTDVQFPDILVSLNVTWNEKYDSATSTHSAADQYFHIFNSGSGGFDPDARVSASASVIPDVQPVRRQIWGQDIPVTNWILYVPNNSTQTEILARLTIEAAATVNAWPVFKPESIVLTLKGQQVSVSAQADTHANFSMNTDSSGALSSTTKTARKGSGQAKEFGTTIRTIEIPPTLHAAITISQGDAEHAQTVTATAVANTTGIYFQSGSNSPVLVTDISNLTNAPVPTSGTASGAITPRSIGATSPTTVPSSGLYLRRMQTEPYRWGYMRVIASVVDFSIFA